MKKISFEIEHPSGDTYMAFELTIDDNGNAEVTKTRNCDLADIDGDYMFDTDNDLYRIQGNWFTHPDSYEEMTERFSLFCEENNVEEKWY